jgi:hypothetical protein
MRRTVRRRSIDAAMARASSDKSPKEKSLESWTWDSACSIRGAHDAPKHKDYILPLILAKRRCEVFADEINRMMGARGGSALRCKCLLGLAAPCSAANDGCGKAVPRASSHTHAPAPTPRRGP